MSQETSKKVDQLLSCLKDPLTNHDQTTLDLTFLSRQPHIRELILKLSSEQDIYADRLLAKRSMIYDSHKLKEFDIFMFQEMDRLILKQQEILCKAGLPFKPSLDLQELQRQKWSLSILLNAIKN
jgi:hypothetical protein